MVRSIQNPDDLDYKALSNAGTWMIGRLETERDKARLLEGMRSEESKNLLSFLYHHMESPGFQCRFRWRKHSLAMWDNRCTQHYALADYWPQHRRVHRVTVIGDRPR